MGHKVQYSHEKQHEMIVRGKRSEGTINLGGQRERERGNLLRLLL